MIKVKDGYAKLIGTTYSGSADRVLLSNGGDKAVSDFAASSHTHSASDITSGTLSVSRGGTGAASFTSGAALIGNGTGAVSTRSITSSATKDSTSLITSGGVYSALSGYLPLAGGIMTGGIVFAHNAIHKTREHTGEYKTGWYNGTGGNEALAFITDSTKTSFMFVTGKNGDVGIDNWTSTTWQSAKPALLIKNNKVSINKLIANDTNASNTLDVNGTAGFAGKVSIAADAWNGLLALTRTNNGSNWGPCITFYDDNGGRGALMMESNKLFISDVSGTTALRKEVSTVGHTHTKSQITDFPTSLPANGGNADTVDNKHAADFAYSISTGANFDCNTTGTHPTTYRLGDKPANAFSNASWSNLLVIGGGDTMTQIGCPYNSDALYFRRGTWYADGTGSIKDNAWKSIIHEGNFNSYAPKLDGTGATGTWGIDISGNADTVDDLHASDFVKFYLSPMDSGASASSAKSWFKDTMPSASGAIVYNVPGSEKTIIAGKSSGAYGHMLQLNYDDTYLRILRYKASAWQSTDWEKISAGYADTASYIHYANVGGGSSDTHDSVLKAYFNNNKTSIPRNSLLGMYSGAYGNGSYYMGYFLSGYDSAPYGGFFVAHYGNPYYVGISNGSYTTQHIITSTNYTDYVNTTNFPGLNSVGDITGVTAGNGLTGGATSGTATLNVGAGTGITVNADDIAVKYGTTAGTACQGNDSRLSDKRSNPNSIKFKNTSDTAVSYDGSSEIDLLDGINYATDSSHLRSCDTSTTSEVTYYTKAGISETLVDGASGWCKPAGVGSDGNSMILRMRWSSGAYGHDIFASPNVSDLYHRDTQNSTNKWLRIVDNSNYTSIVQSLVYGWGSKIADSTDINTLKSPGIYYSSESARSTTMTNPPTKESGFRLATLPGYASSDGKSYGTLLAFASSKVLWRYMGASNGSPSDWFAWIKFKHGTAIGSSTKPFYLTSDGVPTEGSTYAGGTKVTLNGSAKGGSTASFYAPTAVGTSGQYLVSNGSGAPSWKTIDPYDYNITRAANTVLAGPTSGSNASATFRKLVAADIPALSYLPSAGGELTGTLSFNDTSSKRISPMIKFGSNNQDTILWKVYSSGSTYADKGVFGFDMTYKGTGSEDGNHLILHADNQNASSKIAAMTITQSGVITLGKYLTGKIVLPGGSYNWYTVQQYNSSDANPSYYDATCAVININSYTGWQPWIRGVDSENGSWTIGQYTTNLHIGYIPKSNTGNGLTYKWDFGKDGSTVFPGSIKFNKILIPTASNGTTYGAGSSGQVLKSNGSTVYWSSINFSGISFTSGNKDAGEHNCNSITSNGHWYYTSNGPATSLGATTTDGALYSQAYSTDWVAQIAQDYRNGNLFTRGKNNGTWTAWRAVAYQEDTPWSGAPTEVADINTFVKANRSYIGSICLTNGTWYNLISCRHRNGSGDGNAYGLYFYSTLTSTGSLVWNKERNGTWQGARTILDSTNYTDYVKEANFPGLNKTGTVTSVKVGTTSYTPSSGVISLPAYPTNTNYYHTPSYSSGLSIASGTGVNAMYVPNAGESQSGVVNTSTLTFAGAKTFSGAMTVNNTITFGQSDSYGIRTSTDNYGRIGESGKRFYQCYVKNSYSTNGFWEDSDERLKNIIKPIQVDLDEISKLRKIYYIWKNPKDDQSLQLGMIAQDVQRLYPELVSVDKESGYLSLAYDRLSVLALEAIDVLYKEHKKLKERVDKLEKLLKCKGIL